jgi:hypothetical protein
MRRTLIDHFLSINFDYENDECDANNLPYFTMFKKCIASIDNNNLEIEVIDQTCKNQNVNYQEMNKLLKLKLDKANEKLRKRTY